MIFVVEMPPEREPQAWFAFDDEDLLRKVAVAVGSEPWEVWDERSPRELLEMAEATPETPGAAERFPALFALGVTHGWDTTLVRADFVDAPDDDPGLYRAAAITPLEAAVAALQSQGGPMRLYRSEDIALSAVDLPDPLYDAPGGWRARLALRQQLIATEVLADDH